MRFREFSSRRQEQQVDEILPAVAAAGGALARGAGTVAKTVGQGVKAVGQAVGQAVAGAVQGQDQDQQQIQLKPGMNILSPSLGQTKIKSLRGKDAVLDTQKTLGLDVTVKQDELLATLGQNQQGAPGSKSPAAKSPGMMSKMAQAVKTGIGAMGSAVK